MSTNIHQIEQQFANLVRAYRKQHIGKGPEKIKVSFSGTWAIAHMIGSLSPVEKFIAQTEEGHTMIWQARTQMIKQLYKKIRPSGLEELVGAKLLKLYADINVEEDEAISIFVFDKPIDKL
ncbi:DUF2294 domain-containing protein [Paenibacillus sp. GCM10012306]|uniref:DUF2294 domain-containing protein n=1 Tax=Paenibacillus sp. GCM10012306 TaxID=3317342 RepID=UPI003607C7DF